MNTERMWALFELAPNMMKGMWRHNEWSPELLDELSKFPVLRPLHAWRMTGHYALSLWALRGLTQIPGEELQEKLWEAMKKCSGLSLIFCTDTLLPVYRYDTPWFAVVDPINPITPRYLYKKHTSNLSAVARSSQRAIDSEGFLLLHYPLEKHTEDECRCFDPNKMDCSIGLMTWKFLKAFTEDAEW